MRRLQDGGLPIGGEERLGPRELLAERIFLGLRDGGVDLAALRQDFDYDLESQRGEVLAWLRSEGLAGVEDRGLRLTRKGYLVCDEVARRLLARPGDEGAAG